MRVLAAPNAFKGSLSCIEAARAFAEGARRALPGVAIELLPVSDGGDGLLDALQKARGGKRVRVPVHGPFNEKRCATFALLKNGDAIVEMARASGLALNGARRDPLGATSRGTGELIAAAISRGARRVIVGLGGSATNDGGAGMAQALGAKLLDADGRELELGAASLLNLARINAADLRGKLKGVKVIAVSDVTNPLLGPKGSARVYGPQKGASPAHVRLLEKALSRYAAVIKRDLGVSVAEAPGAGAAGGLGAGLVAFLGAELVPGAEWVLEELSAEKKLKASAAVLTGEGKLDRTSFYGKAPVELARMARRLGIPSVLICGQITPEARQLARRERMPVFSFAEAGASVTSSIPAAKHWARVAAEKAVQTLLLACVLLASARAADLKEVDRLYFHRHQGTNLEETIARLEAALKESPDDPQVLWRLGRSLARRGERVENRKEKLALYERAEKFLRRSVELAPTDPDANFWLGVALGRIGQTRGVLKSLFLVGPIKRQMQAVLRLAPDYGGAHHVLGELLWQLPGFAGGDKRKALEEFEAAVRLSPNYTANHGALAEAYLHFKRVDDARRVLEAVAAVKEPADPAEYPDNLKDARALLEQIKP